MIVAGNRKGLVGRILLMSAAVFGILAVLFWSGVMPINEGTRGPIALAFGIAAVGDALLGLIMVTRSDES